MVHNHVGKREGFAFFDLNEDETDFVVVPHQVLELPEKTMISQKVLLERISKVTRDEDLASKTVLIIGLGSGGSVAAKYLGVTGIGKIILVDNDCLELVNVIRHEGTVEDIEKPKTEICKKIIEMHNPFVVVETHKFDVLKERERLGKLIVRSDLVVAASGNAKANNLINRISLDKRVPVVYGGIFESAKGGYVLPVIPDQACFNCLFSLASQAYHVDKDAAEAYNIPEDELHAQQGLWMDISLPALIMTKVALKLLQGENEFFRNYNLFIYKNPFVMQKMKFARRQDCVVCNFEGWVQKQQEGIDADAKKNKQSKLSIFKKILRFSRESGTT